MAVSLHQLLKTMTEMGGTDLHVTTNSAPQIRVDGKLRPLDLPPLTAVETKQLAYSVLTDAQKHRFEENLELDFSFGIKGMARFRANVFMQRGAVAAVYRTIPYEIRSFRNSVPPVVATICDKPRGLVLVTGPTGSGKSTTLASMVDNINNERNEHMITIEDPIEYLHAHKKCVVNQRELYADTATSPSRAEGRPPRGPQRRAHRRNARPRDDRIRFRIAETGHLPSRPCTPTPPPRPSTAWWTCSPPTSSRRSAPRCRWCWRASCARLSCPRPPGPGACLAMEILIPNAAIRNLIREDKIHQIYSSMQTGQEKYGMQTFNQSLATLYFSKQITLQTALGISSMPDELQDMINRGAGLATPQAGGRPPVRPAGR